MKVLMISMDTKVLEVGTPVYKRMIEYASLFEELHVVVLGKASRKANARNTGNLFIYNSTSVARIISFLKSFIIVASVASRIGKGNFITSQDPFESGLVAVVIGKLFKLKIQLQIHTDCFADYFRRHGVFNMIRATTARILIPTAYNLRVVSRRIAESLLQQGLVSDDKVTVLPIFIDIGEMRSRAPVMSLRDKYPEFSKIVVVVGRLEKEKNIPLAMTAFQKMLRMMPGIGLVIVGEGSKLPWLKEYASHLDITPNIRFDGWAPDAVSVFKTADLLLVSSYYEGYGMTIVESLACGCPVVSTDVGIARDAGAILTNFDAGEMALRGVDALHNDIKGELQEGLSMSKDEYLKKYKDTFQ